MLQKNVHAFLSHALVKVALLLSDFVKCSSRINIWSMGSISHFKKFILNNHLLPSIHKHNL